MRNCIVSLVALCILTGCANQPIPKNPPLVPYAQKQWVAVNAEDFVPPKAKTYIKIEEIDSGTLDTQKPTQKDMQEKY